MGSRTDRGRAQAGILVSDRDVPFSVCDLSNPRRDNPRRDGSMTRGELKRTKRRARFSWVDPVDATYAQDDLALEQHMYGRRRKKSRSNPRRTYGGVSRGARRRADQAIRGWGRVRRKRAVGLILGRMNPKRRWRGKGESSKRPRTPSDRDWRGYVAIKRAMKVNPRRKRSHLRRNPKRDGSPTRGEKRRVKYVEYLKEITAAGEEARYHIQSLTGELPKAGAGAFEPMGKRAENRLMKEHSTGWEAQHKAERKLAHAEEIGDDRTAREAETELSKAKAKVQREEAREETAAAHAAEAPELKFLKESLHEIDVLQEDYRKQIAALSKVKKSEGEMEGFHEEDRFSEDEDENAAEIEMLQEQIAKLARRKKELRTEMEALGTVKTNPGGRRRRSVRLSPRGRQRLHQRARQLSRSIHACRKALVAGLKYLRTNRR